MKTVRAVVIAVLMFLSSCAAAVASPAATVRAVHYGETQGCSAVVIAPDYALTARHCLTGGGITVDGMTVDYVAGPAIETRDIALLHAPGLACPCAAIGERPQTGDVMAVIGYPAEQPGVRKEIFGQVHSVGTVLALAPFFAGTPYADVVMIFSDKPILEAGESGGGMFVVQNDEWRLVGINVIGVPDRPAYNATEIASGFTPVDFASSFLPRR